MNQGDRLRAARKEAKLSQEALADRANINRVTVTQIESGSVKTIDGEKLIKICDALSITERWLVFGQADINAKAAGTRLKTYIEEQGIPNESLSKSSSVCLNKIRNAEKGIYKLSESDYQKIAQVLEKPAADIMYGADRRHPLEVEHSESEQHIPSTSTVWPEKPEDISVAFIEDIAERVSKAINVDITEIRKTIAGAVMDHYAEQTTSEAEFHKAAEDMLKSREANLPDDMKLSDIDRKHRLAELIKEMRKHTSRKTGKSHQVRKIA